MSSPIEWAHWVVARRRTITKRGGKTDIRAFASRDSEIGMYCGLGRGARLLSSSIGDFTYLAYDAVVSDTIAGKFCSIGAGSRIGGLGTHPTRWISTHPAFYSSRRQVPKRFSTKQNFEEHRITNLGHDVWVGARALILDGVSIGNGAIIAAGAVVAGDVDAYAIVGGVPAKLIRYRFHSEIRSCLGELKWWDCPPAVLERLAPLFIAKEKWDIKDVLALKAIISGTT